MKTFPTLLLVSAFAHAATTIDPANPNAYGANVGWVNARGDVSNGAVVGEFICSGSIYSANCGWIHLGSGAPANGIRYQNSTATDFGVNTQDYVANGVTFEAKLRGYAYGANIGWVNFESNGNPRVDLSTGRLLGFAYSANVGWIALSGTGVTLATTAIAAGIDSDGDGIPDAWERSFAGNITTLGAGTDRDRDGVSDVNEYAADTHPLDPSDRLQITLLMPPRQLVANGPFLTDLGWTSKPSRKYAIETNPDLLSLWDAPLTGIIPSSGAATTLRFTDIQAGKRFYRVRAKLPLSP